MAPWAPCREGALPIWSAVLQSPLPLARWQRLTYPRRASMSMANRRHAKATPLLTKELSNSVGYSSKLALPLGPPTCCIGLWPNRHLPGQGAGLPSAS